MEQRIFDMILAKNPWDQVLYQIVSYEGLDPWNLDIVKLGNIFIDYTEKSKVIDFKISSNFIIISTILLRMKSDFLIVQELTDIENEDADETVEYNEEEIIDIPKIPIIPLNVMRLPKRKVSLNELIVTLKNILSYDKKKKKIDYNIIQDHLTNIIENDDSLEHFINELYEKIKKSICNTDNNFVNFNYIVKSYDKDTTLKTFLSLLHLLNSGKIECEQLEPFEDIIIKLK